MATPLREVLARFTEQAAPLSVSQLAREMAIEPGLLHDMIGYWVRKGKLREIVGSSQACTACGSQRDCPFIVALPRYYELAGSADDAAPPPCACGGACNH